MQVKEPLWIQAKEEYEAEVEFFISPVPLREGKSIFQCAFPVENRIIHQNPDYLKKLIEGRHGENLTSALLDFHLLLFLSGFYGEAVSFQGPQTNPSDLLFSQDLANLCQEVLHKTLSEGNELIVRGIAGEMV